jgi:hypothetical protein
MTRLFSFVLVAIPTTSAIRHGSKRRLARVLLVLLLLVSALFLFLLFLLFLVGCLFPGTMSISRTITQWTWSAMHLHYNFPMSMTTTLQKFESDTTKYHSNNNTINNINNRNYYNQHLRPPIPNPWYCEWTVSSSSVQSSDDASSLPVSSSSLSSLSCDQMLLTRAKIQHKSHWYFLGDSTMHKLFEAMERNYPEYQPRRPSKLQKKNAPLNNTRSKTEEIQETKVPKGGSGSNNETANTTKMDSSTSSSPTTSSSTSTTTTTRATPKRLRDRCRAVPDYYYPLHRLEAWVPPNPNQGEGPTHYGKDHPYCADCSGCWNRQVVLYTQTTTKTTTTTSMCSSTSTSTSSSETRNNCTTSIINNNNAANNNNHHQTTSIMYNNNADSDDTGGMGGSSTPTNDADPTTSTTSMETKVVDRFTSLEYLAVEYPLDVEFPTSNGTRTTQETVALYLKHQQQERVAHQEWIQEMRLKQQQQGGVDRNGGADTTPPSRSSSNNNSVTNNAKAQNNNSISSSYSSSSSRIALLERLRNDTVCVVNTGLHPQTLSRPALSTAKYVSLVLDYYLPLLTPTCSTLIWLFTSATMDDPNRPQRNAKILEWNLALEGAMQQRDTTRRRQPQPHRPIIPNASKEEEKDFDNDDLSSPVAIFRIDVWNQSLQSPHKDNVHLIPEYYYDPLSLLFTALF